MNQLREKAQEVASVEKWLLPQLLLDGKDVLRRLKRSSPIGVLDNVPFARIIHNIEDVIAAAEIRKQELIDATSLQMQHATSHIHDGFMPSPLGDDLHLPPQGLLRYYTPDSYSKFDERLRFLCPSWPDCGTAQNFQEILHGDPRTLDKLRMHCEDSKDDVSDWISAINSPAWVLERINEKWPIEQVSGEDVCVALINTTKTKQLNINFERSDLLVQGAGGRPYRENIEGGVKYAWYKHFLVYRWIPKCCIATTFTLPEFRVICQRRGIQNSKRPSLWNDIAISGSSIDVTSRWRIR